MISTATLSPGRMRNISSAAIKTKRMRKSLIRSDCRQISNRPNNTLGERVDEWWMRTRSGWSLWLGEIPGSKKGLNLPVDIAAKSGGAAKDPPKFNYKGLQRISAVMTSASLLFLAVYFGHSLPPGKAEAAGKSYDDGQYYSDEDEPRPPPSTKSSSYGQALSRSFVADAAEIASPSVVNIISSVNSGILSGSSSGSGFIISKDGFIVTNAHVVANNSADGRVLVNFWDGRKKNGIVHAMDRKSDIAIIKIERDNSNSNDNTGVEGELPTATLGSSDQLRIGDFVLALGSPLSLQKSVSFGIVSSLARHGSELGVSLNRSDFIQTDAAINVGNSGGPLVNLDGHVIGISTMKAQGVDGISFAIPIDSAVPIIRQLIRNRVVVRPYIGFRIVNFFPDASQTGKGGTTSVSPSQRLWGSRGRGGNGNLLSVEQPQALVVAVEPNSPAQHAGLQRGDLIMEFDGKKVNGIKDILESIGFEVGRVIELKVQRGPTDRKEVISLRLKTAPEDRK